MQQSSQQQIKEHTYILQEANDKLLNERCAVEQRTGIDATAQLPAPSHSTQLI